MVGYCTTNRRQNVTGMIFSVTRQMPCLSSHFMLVIYAVIIYIVIYIYRYTYVYIYTYIHTYIYNYICMIVDPHLRSQLFLSSDPYMLHVLVYLPTWLDHLGLVNVGNCFPAPWFAHGWSSASRYRLTTLKSFPRRAGGTFSMIGREFRVFWHDKTIRQTYEKLRKYGLYSGFDQFSHVNSQDINRFEVWGFPFSIIFHWAAGIFPESKVGRIGHQDIRKNR